MLGIKNYPLVKIFNELTEPRRVGECTCRSLSPFPCAYRSYSLNILAKLHPCNFLRHPITTPLYQPESDMGITIDASLYYYVLTVDNFGCRGAMIMLLLLIPDHSRERVPWQIACEYDIFEYRIFRTTLYSPAHNLDRPNK